MTPVTTEELENPHHRISASLYFNGTSGHVYLNPNNWRFHIRRMCQNGLNQANLPTAYDKIHYDVHISRQKR